MLNSFKAIESGRIDKVMSSHLNISRSQIERLIKSGNVSVNKTIVNKNSYKISVDDIVEFEFQEAIPKEPINIDFDIDILYEDEYLLVINKPSGLVVHPAPSVKEATVVDWLINKGISLSTISGEERHGIVHRIDKDTTGALVIAKDNKTHQLLSKQLENKSMGRYYLAIIDYPLKDSISVEKPIGRNKNNRLKMDIVNDGKYAKTSFVKLMETSQKTELIAAKLFTGRTHQIRVHLNSIGRHILGDEVYGFKSKRDKISRVYLHAYLLYLKHPINGKDMEFIAPLFEDMNNYIHHYFDEDEIIKKLNPINIKNSFKEEICHT